MAQHRKLDLLVAYCSLREAEAGLDPEFATTVKWDVPLLDGYRWVEVPNKGSGDESFFGFYNPGLWDLIRDGHFDAVLCFTGYLRASFWIAWVRATFPGCIYFRDGCNHAGPEGRLKVEGSVYPANLLTFD
jgi:hypothetical protein